MNSEIIQFLTRERVCVLSVILADGSPHAATVHFSMSLESAEPLKIYIQTYDASTKAQPFLDGKTGKAAVVFGFSEQDWQTLQMRGSARRVTVQEELDKIYKIHYAKNPEAEKHKSSKTVVLEFTPTWWRYTDLKTKPPTVIEGN